MRWSPAAAEILLDFAGELRELTNKVSPTQYGPANGIYDGPGRAGSAC
jgi:hypothetical protein